ncbi:DUF4145 domain-containing protein [Burkholderia gladioli]|uniref:DUF4145 domain-containing protein n=1 Tax=Burkholderia gladioli TaxID=28095 RepID=UPI00163EF378|nr:DUF4145 domain-containing protein [Burkholderia gladioli]
MFERDLWVGAYTREEFPRYTCPRCKKGRLLQNQSSFLIEEPGFSQKDSQHPDWEPGWEKERFSLRLICDNADCGEIVIVSGDTTVAEYYEDEFNAWGLISLLRPQAFFPAPSIISVPEQVPQNVCDEIDKASQLFWMDFSASANRLRVSVELLLDYFKVPRDGVNGKGKPRRLDLHARIALFEKSDPDHAPTLTALRMIGNLGSHGGQVNREPLLDAFEIYEYALTELCGQRKARIAQLRQKLIESKGHYK